MNKNTTIIAISTIICFIIIFNYDFTKKVIKDKSLYDFKFKNFSIYNISKDSIDINIHSQSGSINKNTLKLNNSSVSFRNKKTNKIHHVSAQQMLINKDLFLINDNIKYRTDNIYISTDFMKFNIKEQTIQTKDSLAVVNNLKLNSSFLSIDFHKNLINAKNIKLLINENNI
jgi:hypothetical protein